MEETREYLSHNMMVMWFRCNRMPPKVWWLEGKDRHNTLKEQGIVSRKRSKGRNFSSITNFLQHFLDLSQMTHNMAADQYKACPWGEQINMVTRKHHRSMWRRLKLGHNYETYNVDLCQIDTNLSTSMTIQMWIHAGTHTIYSITTWGK